MYTKPCSTVLGGTTRVIRVYMAGYTGILEKKMEASILQSGKGFTLKPKV